MVTKTSQESTEIKALPYNLLKLKQLAMDYRRQIIGLISVLVLIFAVFGAKKSQDPPTPFEEFALSTARTFKEINNVRLPPSNEVVRYKVECLRTGNMVQNSPAFPNGNRISQYLENCGKAVAGAGYSLQAMYQRGNNLFTTYNVELRDMVKTLRADTPMNVQEYIINRMIFLRKEVQEYQAKVSHTRDQVLLAEEAQNMAEKELLNGKRHGEKYLADKKKDGKSAEVKSTVEELSHVIDVLSQMHVIAQQLGLVNNVLLHYNDMLLEIEGRIKVDGRVQEKDIELLWRLGEDLKALHERGVNKNMIGSG